MSGEDYATQYVIDECKRRHCTPEEIDDDDVKMALAAQALEWPIFMIRNSFHTVSKSHELVSIEPFKAQIVLDITCESQRRIGVAERVITIKYRQLGSTTWFLGRGMQKGLQPNNIIVVMVPDDEVAKTINKRVGDIYNNLGWMTPMRRIENQKNVTFSNPDPRTRDFDKGLDSQIVIVVPGPLRGISPISTLILSEFAHIGDTSNIDPTTMLDGVLTGMSKGPETAVYIDTTPNGYDEDYWPMAKEAIDRNPKWVKSWLKIPFLSKKEIIEGALGLPDRPDVGWVPYFSPFTAHEEYTTRDYSPVAQRPRLTAERKRELEASLGKMSKYGNDEEIELIKKYGATLGTLAWRRYTIDNDIQGFDERQKLLTFRQEYAHSWESCFVDYGNSAFDPLGLEAISKMGREPTGRGLLRQGNEGGFLRWYIDHNLYEWDEMRFWAPSEGTEKYVIGVDLGWNFESLECDQTYAHVFRRRDRKQVAVYESRAPMHRVRECLYSLYRYYNNALIGVETKGPGKNLCYELWQMGVRNQYRWKRLDQEMPEETKWLGWETGPNTRPGMEGILMEEIAHRDPSGEPMPGIILRDQKTIDQLRSLKRYPDNGGKIKARSGSHDDAADGLMITLAVDRDPLNPYMPKREARLDRDIETGTMLGNFGRLLSNTGRRERGALPNLRDL